MNELNPQQHEAVLRTDGHVLVLAGAGSGKTRVLTERIAYLVREKRVSPERILAFTFTNKAAGEMRARVEHLLERRNLPFWIGTFHATGVKILRREAKHIGYGNNFAIFDEDDSISQIREIIKKRGVALDDFPPKAVRNRISRWKNALVLPDEAMNSARDGAEEFMAEVYRRYTAALKKCNAFDFDDLITRVVELFAAHPKVRARYARQFRYVLVDEFQDTNKIQMVMIDALAGHHHNLFVVGDDDQAIYGWRGATVENILQFDSLYPGTVMIRLEENYRSTNRILEAANALIAHNAGRKGKNLWSKRGKGEQLCLHFAEDEIEEADAVRETIIRLIKSGRRRNEIAVLYRTHAQSRALENAMRRGGLPYQIIGGVRFYERKEIKDLLGYLKLINNPRDDVGFKRIVNVPRRGIGQVTLDRIEKHAGDRSLLLSTRAAEGLEAFSPAQRERVENFSKLMARLELMAATETVHDLLTEVIEKTGYREYLMEDPATAQTRLENIDELLVETKRFVSSSADAKLPAFLEEIALFSDIDYLTTEETVPLMTLHNSKGLEYPIVLITGLEDGLLPHYSSFDNDGELEEERRLFYVGITRAKERVFLFSAANRMRFGTWSGNPSSRFLEEIPAHMINVTGGGRATDSAADLFKRMDTVVPAGANGSRSVAGRRFRVGAFVTHPSYGEGTIKKVEGSGKEMMVTVQFPGKGTKKFLACYAPFRFSR